MVRKLVVKNAGVVKAEFNAKITGEKEKESPFVVHFGGTGFNPKIVFNSTAQVFPRTVKQILNDQIADLPLFGTSVIAVQLEP